MPADVSEDSADSVDRFAAHLRRLQREAGDLTGVALAHHARLSKTVVADALAGKKLPSERTIARLAVVLGSDAAELIERRNALHAQMSRSTIIVSPITVESDAFESGSTLGRAGGQDAVAGSTAYDDMADDDGAAGPATSTDHGPATMDDGARRTPSVLGLGAMLLVCFATSAITAGITAAAVVAFVP